MAFGRLIVANQELRRARAELAELAVAEERLRFGRDLHDLLGHSLSIIALKAELARRMLPDEPERAAAEVEQVHEVARNALAEVRQTVTGYRRPTLAGELASARMALEAAGIAVEVEDPAMRPPQDAEAVLAWTVREGTTNVIRHSNARRASIRITPGLVDATAEVVDDGRGANGGPPDGGQTRILILTTFGRPGYLRRAMEGGAAGFLLKDAPVAELARAIRRAMAGERIVDPSLAAAALSEGESPLTEREREVLLRAREDGTVAEIAASLHLSPGTTRNHLSVIMGKLDAHSRIEAIRIAETKGWL